MVGPKESTLDGAGLMDGTVDARRVGVSLGLEDKLGPTLRMRLGGLDATALGLIEGIPVDGAAEDNLEGMLEGELEGQSAVVITQDDMGIEANDMIALGSSQFVPNKSDQVSKIPSSKGAHRSSVTIVH